MDMDDPTYQNQSDEPNQNGYLNPIILNSSNLTTNDTTIGNGHGFELNDYLDLNDIRPQTLHNSDAIVNKCSLSRKQRYCVIGIICSLFIMFIITTVICILVFVEQSEPPKGFVGKRKTILHHA